MNYPIMTLKRAVVVLDSSFVLNSSLQGNNFDSHEFFENALRYTRFKSRIPIKLLDSIFREIRIKVAPYMDKEDTLHVLRKLRYLGSGQPYTELLNDPMNKLFYEKISKVGNEFSNVLCKRELSIPDKLFCTSVLDYSRYGNVAAATRDNVVTETLNELFPVVHKVLVNRGYPDSSLTILKDNNDLISLIESYMPNNYKSGVSS